MRKPKPTTKTKPRGAIFTLRFRRADLALIERAACAAGMTRNKFIIRAACRAAHATLLAAGMAAAPETTVPNAQLRRTMRTTQPWS